jgi:hypothetical protein
MNEFEKKFKNLPWAQPRTSLRQSIFGNTRPEPSFRLYRIFNRAAGWAALWLITGSLLGYGLGRGQSTVAAPEPSFSDVIVVETDAETQFFNQTDEIYEAIPGEWVLQIEPEGGIQG